MKKTFYKVTWDGKAVFVSATYYMGAIQRAAELWGVKPQTLTGKVTVEERYQFESVKR